MKIIFLGTNGWYSTELGNTSCILIDSEKYFVILDAGDGFYKLDRYLTSEKPIFLLLSHIHLDHIIGLHTISKFRLKQELEIFGYRGVKNYLESIIRHPYTTSFSELPLKVQIHELDEGIGNLPFELNSRLLVHSDPCLGYRIKLENHIITYCMDTGMCDALFQLANHADLFITECAFKPEQAEWGWPHLRPEEAAIIARDSMVKSLVLTHFDASIYCTRKDRKRVEKETKKIYSNVTLAYDGKELQI